MVNNTTNTSAGITKKDQKLEDVTGCKYMVTTCLRIRIDMTTETMTRLRSRLLTISYIFFITKHKLYKYPVVLILLYGCDIWTPNADIKCKGRDFEHKCLQRL
ncbi:hypothetical protein DPMN_054552 [Dreissena polymorpha]|uniref:Uncharacterized protein n=1 Tax=Dreissena polymorpha TaxID=45954 RepID=A0A9D4CPU9_DREPO|nr:hypothetical protein DPMN_054552 [Dreissena polymorpha]